MRFNRSLQMNITFPYFCMYAASYYKITSENRGIQVSPVKEPDCGIQIVHYPDVIGTIVYGGETITEEKYITKFNETLTFLTNLK